MPNKMTLEVYPFNQLTTQQLHDLMRLRIDVFVVEQNCPYPEIDGRDTDALHVLGTEDEKIVAYTRILPAGSVFPEVSFGRVLVAESHRGKRLGHDLLKCTLSTIEAHHGPVPVRISAQVYLVAYYQQYGFKIAGEEYLEDGLPHVDMLRT